MLKTSLLLLLLLCIGISSQTVILPPDSVGISVKRLKRLDAAMQKYVDEGKLPGVTTLIYRRGSLVHFRPRGYHNIESKSPIRVDSIFRIYSMSKPVICTAMMMLYEEGHFQLYDPISKFIPEFKDLKVYAGMKDGKMILENLQREPTIRDLLMHTGGFSYGFIYETPVDMMYRKAKLLDRNQPLKQMIQKLAKIPLKHQPGSKWEYSISVDILGYLVEVISKKSLDVFLKERLFLALGMVDTDFYVPEDKLSRFVDVYGPNEDHSGIHVVDGVGNTPFAEKPLFLSGGGGLVSTASDYMLFCQMLLNKGKYKDVQILGRKTVELMTENHLTSEQMPYGVRRPLAGFGFGFGVYVTTDVPATQLLGSRGSFGWSGLANTYFIIDPKEQMIAMVLTQFLPHSYYPLYQDFHLLLYQSIVD